MFLAGEIFFIMKFSFRNVSDDIWNYLFVITADLRVHEFFKTPYFKTGIHPLPGAQKALHKLSRYCNLSVVTYVWLEYLFFMILMI